MNFRDVDDTKTGGVVKSWTRSDLTAMQYWLSKGAVNAPVRTHGDLRRSS